MAPLAVGAKPIHPQVILAIVIPLSAVLALLVFLFFHVLQRHRASHVYVGSTQVDTSAVSGNQTTSGAYTPRGTDQRPNVISSGKNDFNKLHGDDESDRIPDHNNVESYARFSATDTRGLMFSSPTDIKLDDRLPIAALPYLTSSRSGNAFMETCFSQLTKHGVGGNPPAPSSQLSHASSALPYEGNDVSGAPLPWNRPQPNLSPIACLVDPTPITIVSPSLQTPSALDLYSPGTTEKTRAQNAESPVPKSTRHRSVVPMLRHMHMFEAGFPAQDRHRPYSRHSFCSGLTQDYNVEFSVGLGLIIEDSAPPPGTLLYPSEADNVWFHRKLSSTSAISSFSTGVSVVMHTSPYLRSSISSPACLSSSSESSSASVSPFEESPSSSRESSLPYLAGARPTLVSDACRCSSLPPVETEQAKVPPSKESSFVLHTPVSPAGSIDSVQSSIFPVDERLNFRYDAVRRTDQLYPIHLFTFAFLQEQQSRGHRIGYESNQNEAFQVLDGAVNNANSALMYEIRRAEYQRKQATRRAVRMVTRNLWINRKFKEGDPDSDEEGPMTNSEDDEPEWPEADWLDSEAGGPQRSVVADAIGLQRQIRWIGEKEGKLEHSERGPFSLEKHINMLMTRVPPDEALLKPDHPNPIVREKMLRYWRRRAYDAKRYPERCKSSLPSPA